MDTPDAAAAMNALRKIVRFLRLADREVAAVCGLSAAQLFVLHTLVDGPGLSLAEVAERTLTDQSSVSTVVARLVDRGFVIRKPSRSDKRRAELSLSAAGRKMVLTAPHPPQTQMIAAIQAMPAQRRAELVQSLDVLATVMGANDVPPRMLFEDEPAVRRKRR
jgi:DNA-binding MarR family transcriptional regulator